MEKKIRSVGHMYVEEYGIVLYHTISTAPPGETRFSAMQESGTMCFLWIGKNGKGRSNAPRTECLCS